MEPTNGRKSFLYDVLLPKVELLAWLSAVLGFVAKWHQLEVGSPLLRIGLLGLANVFCFQAFRPYPATVAPPDAVTLGASGIEQNQLASVVTNWFLLYDVLLPKVQWLSATVVLVGILFKLQSVEGNSVLLRTGLLTLVPAIVLSAFKRHLDVRLALVAALGALLLYTSSEALVRQFHRNDPALAEKISYHLHQPRHRPSSADITH